MKKISEIGSYAAIVIGAILASFAVAAILLPNDAIDYGTAGLGIILSKLSGINLSIAVMITFLPFFIVGRIFLGRHFAIKAVVGEVVYMAGLAAFEHIELEVNTEHFIAVAFGGAVLGVGLSLILKFGGCIDGSEILANIIVSKVGEKTGKNYSMTGILLVFNAFVYTLVFILIDQNAALLSVLVFVVATVIIEHFTDHFESVKQVTIITKDPDYMIERIRNEMHKTCTVMDSYGAISGANKTLICYVTYFELEHLREIIEEDETKAFITVSTIDEIIQ